MQATKDRNISVQPMRLVRHGACVIGRMEVITVAKKRNFQKQPKSVVQGLLEVVIGLFKSIQPFSEDVAFRRCRSLHRLAAFGAFLKHEQLFLAAVLSQFSV